MHRYRTHNCGELRDAHIGVLWEGTSNINALDIITRAVGAERAASVAQVPDERAQVGLGREVTRRQRGDEDVVLRAVRVQDLCHRRPAYPNARPAKLARACWPGLW